ncbi:uncharacterized protein EAF01_004593 [Botrytis porri]|uniref:uncharacterized protein n=1 Tax=Botrytis porri TaxID=87229 RepID=UPI0019016BF2|nr:uncharacterized protein EAF01_004593 [Botrytis porri]KAF7907006.1 hypothetical protein EAF01_004593 [Botrytis porri]
MKLLRLIWLIRQHIGAVPSDTQRPSVQHSNKKTKQEPNKKTKQKPTKDFQPHLEETTMCRFSFSYKKTRDHDVEDLPTYRPIAEGVP